MNLEEHLAIAWNIPLVSIEEEFNNEGQDDSVSSGPVNDFENNISTESSS